MDVNAKWIAKSFYFELKRKEPSEISDAVGVYCGCLRLFNYATAAHFFQNTTPAKQSSLPALCLLFSSKQ